MVLCNHGGVLQKEAERKDYYLSIRQLKQWVEIVLGSPRFFKSTSYLMKLKHYIHFKGEPRIRLTSGFYNIQMQFSWN